MNEATLVNAALADHADRFDGLMAAASALFEGERDFIANAANLSSLLYHSLDDVNWCGFYLERKGQLVLGPFQGRVACVRIPVGKGVCGTAAQSRQPLVVPDVHMFPGHIACDPSSRSEIVIPLLDPSRRLLGVLDVDSPVPDRFGPVDEDGLSRLVRLLVAASERP